MAKINSSYKKQGNLIDSIGCFIFYLMVGLIPHIYRYVEFSPSKSESAYFKSDVYVDLYMLAKSRVFLFLTLALLCVFAYQVFNKEIKLIKDKIFIGTGIGALIIILSSILSPYQDLVYWGAKDRFEGMWVWLAYLVIFTVARHYGANKQFANRLLKVFVLSASLMAVFGLMQINGYDIYTAGPMRWLCFPKEMAGDMSKYMVENTTEALAVGALYNSNYFGVYSAVSVMGGLVLFLNGGLKSQVIFGLAAVLNYGAMIASRSEAALLGFVVGIFVLLLSNARLLWKKRWILAMSLLALIAVDRTTVDMLKASQSTNAKYIYLLLGVTIVLGILVSFALNKSNGLRDFMKKRASVLGILLVVTVALGFNALFMILPMQENGRMIESIALDDNTLKVKMKGDEPLTIDFLITGVDAYGEDGRLIIAESVADNIMTFKTRKNTYNMSFKHYSNGYVITIQSPFSFHAFYDGKTIQYVNPITEFGEIEYPKRVLFYYNKGNLFTKRGYIWGTYLPIMSEHFLIGNGLDTYPIIFPQNDIVGKHNNFLRFNDIVVDKPHSMYIMLGLATGVVGMILFLILISLLITRYFKLMANEDGSSRFMVMLSVFFIAGIFNDSVIPISIIMFILSGTLIGKEA